jgi:hypothetical protein
MPNPLQKEVAMKSSAIPWLLVMLSFSINVAMARGFLEARAGASTGETVLAGCKSFGSTMIFIVTALTAVRLIHQFALGV